jgi:hypothetical protein
MPQSFRLHERFGDDAVAVGTARPVPTDLTPRVTVGV